MIMSRWVHTVFMHVWLHVDTCLFLPCLLHFQCNCCKILHLFTPWTTIMYLFIPFVLSFRHNCASHYFLYCTCDTIMLICTFCYTHTSVSYVHIFVYIFSYTEVPFLHNCALFTSCTKFETHLSVSVILFVPLFICNSFIFNFYQIFNHISSMYVAIYYWGYLCNVSTPKSGSHYPLCNIPGTHQISL